MHPSKARFATALAAVCGVLGTVAHANQWPSFRGNLNNTGYTTVAGPVGPNVVVKWSYDAGVDIHSTPCIDAAGNLYFGAGGSIHSVSSNGTRRWRFATPKYQMLSSPALSPDGTYVYIGSFNFMVYSLFTANGTVAWSYNTTGTVSSSPNVAPDGTVYVGSWNNLLLAFAPDGTPLGNYTTGLNGNPTGGIRGVAAIDPAGNVYTTSCDENIYMLTPHTLEAAASWTPFEASAYIVASPALSADGVLYYGGMDFNIYAIQAVTGTPLWATATNNQWVTASAAIGPDGSVYVGAYDNCFYVLNGTTGAIEMNITTQGVITGSAIIAGNNVVYVPSWDHNLYAFSTETGAKLWSFPTGAAIDASPVLGSDGTLYITSMDHKLYALRDAESVTLQPTSDAVL